MRRLVLLLVVSLAVVAGVSRAGGSAGPRWVITDLGTLGLPKSEALALNEVGQVVGYAVATDGRSRAFLWEKGRLRDLGVGYAVAINEHGQAVGYKDSGRYRDQRQALLWEKGKARILDSSFGDCSSGTAVAVDGSGRVVGWGGDKESCSLSMSIAPQALLWAKGAMSTLAVPNSVAAAINERGQVLINVWDEQALVWEKGRATKLGTLGGKFDGSRAASINERGQIVGYSQTTKGTSHAFLWQKGRILDLGTLPGGKSSSIDGVTRVGDLNFSNYYPHAINEAGQVVGTSTTANGRWHPFLWQNGRMTDLAARLPDAKNSWWSQPTINDRGQVVATMALRTTTVERAYVWQNGKATALGTLGGASSFAAAINNHGEVIGSSTTKTGQTHAVLWTLRSG